MGKYDPLMRHLTSRGAPRVQMTFGEIERILGFPLPPSSRKHRAWWSNNPTNSVMTRAWLDAGYQSREVDLDDAKLVFVRLNEVAAEMRTGQHPLIGCMKGTITIAPGVDLTEPTMPEWDDMVVAKFDRLMKTP